jgi:hypothetical protein
MKNLTIKQELGQFFSSNEELIKDHIKYVSKDDLLIDPFAGMKDLLKFFDNRHEAYDIMPMLDDIIYNDSINNPPSYKGKFIITNPPYLASNKTDKYADLFEKFNTDDLYKVSVYTFIPEAEKGIIILPTGMWFNERNQSFREKFLSTFTVYEVSVFNKQMFKDTSYSVCSFYFERKNISKHNIKFKIIDVNNNIDYIELSFSKENNFSIINDVYKTFKKYKNKLSVGRYTEGNIKGLTKIKLDCLDNINSKIKCYIDEPFKGIETDRAFITFTINGITLTLNDQNIIVNEFNKRLNKLRVLYQDSFLSNYRNNGRKRISFGFAYALIEDIISDLF